MANTYYNLSVTGAQVDGAIAKIIGMGTDEYLSVNNSKSAIPTGSDLNDYTTPGRYTVGSGTIAGGIVNIPTKVAGILIVMRLYQNNRHVQFYIAGSGNAMFRRTYVGSWSSWKEM